MQRKNSHKNKIQKNSGMTIVEVIVAFAILMIGLGSLYKATVVSGNMVNKAQEIQTQVDDVMNQYYKEELAPVSLTVTAKITEKAKPEEEDGTQILDVPVQIKDYSNSEGYHIYAIEKEKPKGAGE